MHQGMKAYVEAGELGAKTGKGFYDNGQPRSDGETEFDADELAQRFVLKAFVEACLVLEDGMATVRDIDLGMMAGAGMIPPPFARADQTGLDDVLAALETAAAEWGEQFEPPMILRRLVAQGRLGAKSGQGFFAYKQPDAEGFEQGEAVTLETRDGYAIAWLDRPPANSLSPQVIEELTRVWDHVDVDESIRALIIASANPMLWCAGADIKAFTKLDATSGAAMLDDAHGLLRRMEQSSTVTIAAINAVAFGGGCELAMGCDVRIAAQSASFGQPEINLGIIPGFGGTQRLPRLVGTARALELNLTGDPISADEAYEIGSGQPGRARPRAARRGAGVGAQARRPGAAGGRGDQAHDGRRRRPRRGHRGREGRLRGGLRVGRRPRGHRRVPRQAHAAVDGQVAAGSDPAAVAALAELVRSRRRRSSR